MAKRTSVTSLLGSLNAAPSTDEDVDIYDIVYDSRMARPETVFVALRGARADGHDFAAAAVAAGCTALVVDHRLDGITAPQWVVDDTRLALAVMSARFFGKPSEKFSLAGITGTNGKTTTAYMLESIYRAAGRKTGLIGTVEYKVGDTTVPVTRTTPESYELQKLLRQMADAGVEMAAMEVSSHAIAQHRTAAVTFAAQVFTNLTQDHLDYHGDMETYYRAKEAFFAGTAEPAVLNIDDHYGRRLAKETMNAITFGLGDAADYRATDIAIDISGARFTIVAPDTKQPIVSPVPGAFNVMNALAAATTARAQGIAWPAITAGLAELRQIPGRFERLDSGRGFAVVIDYAHTPDSLMRAAAAARELATGRVITVFGCGGDRDKGKRPLMGAAAAAGSDVVVITSDNPRGEEPEAIIEDIKAGIKDACETVIDREAAIRRAIELAGPGDIVLIAGKGHEKEQIFADHTVAFDDRAVAEEILKERERLDD